MSDKLRSDEIRKNFKDKKVFNLTDIRQFYSEDEPDLNENTLLSRIFYLKKKGIINPAGRGSYTLENRSEFRLSPGDAETEWYRKLSGQFPHIRMCIWSTATLGSITGRTTGRPLILAEVDRVATETIFRLLGEFTSSVFLSPDRVILERYVPMHEAPVVVVPLITEAPLDMAGDIPVPSAEKLIVDMLSEPYLLSQFQGKVLREFITRVFRSHQVNPDRLNRYAARRNKKSEIRILLRELSLG
jgi:hypothetical protein